MAKLTKEQKRLLFSALCELLHSKKPVKLRCWEDVNENGRRSHRYKVATLRGLIVKKDGIFVDVEDDKTWAAATYPLEDVRPFLRPYSSMTKDEEAELQSICDIAHVVDGEDYGKYNPIHCIRVYPEVKDIHVVDWFVNHRLDYRGLILKDLAYVAPRGMYRYRGYTIK